MFKNAIIYRIDQWDRPALSEFEERMEAAAFTECGATQQESAGWVAPSNEKGAALIESIGGQIIVKLCTETKAVPGSVIKTQLDKRLDKIADETGRRPKGKAAKELKEEILLELLPRAFPKRSSTLVWIDTKGRTVLIDAGSTRTADKVATRLIEVMGGGLMLSLAHTQISPATAMAHWLASKEAPAGFSIDRQCELKQPDSEKSTVRYARHTLDIDEVGEHIKQGKLPTQLEMTWASRVSFVLTESMALKRIRLLDVVLEGQAETDADAFDTDVAITTGELGRLIPALIEALGGLLDFQI